MTHYRGGTQFENDVLFELEERYGFGAVRMAGSHGTFKTDLIAAHPDGTLLFIQCKKNDIRKINPHEWNTMFLWANRVEAVPILASRDQRRGHMTEFIYEEITGPRVLYARGAHPKVLYDMAKHGMMST